MIRINIHETQVRLIYTIHTRKEGLDDITRYHPQTIERRMLCCCCTGQRSSPVISHHPYLYMGIIYVSCTALKLQHNMNKSYFVIWMKSRLVVIFILLSIIIVDQGLVHRTAFPLSFTPWHSTIYYDPSNDG